MIRVINFASVTPTYTATASLFDATEQVTAPLVEAYTLTCEIDGVVRQTLPVVVDRGQQVGPGVAGMRVRRQREARVQTAHQDLEVGTR